MCGIVGYTGTKKAVPVLINGLLSLEYRGYDSAGLAVLTPQNSIEIIKDKGRVHNLESQVQSLDFPSTIGIAHTRWATHGIPSKQNAHPHVDNSNKFAVVHNGIIENYAELKNKLIQNGYTLYSETDTEIIPNLINLYYDGDILKAIEHTLKDLKGSYAIEVLSPLYPDKIFVAKKDSPLVIGTSPDGNYIASDIPAIIKYTHNFYFMEDNQIAVIDKKSVNFFDINLNPIKIDLKTIDWSSDSSDKNGYEDYMLKEIYEQPTAVRETIGTKLDKDLKINLDLDNIDFSKFNKIYIVACGTAMHAGIATKNIFEQLCKIPTIVDMASEFRYNNPLIDSKTLFICISQSGETADTIAALKLANSMDCTTIAIVNVQGSSITRYAHHTLYTHAGPEIAVASTKAYTCQLTLLTLLALYMSERLFGESKLSIDLKKELLDIPEKIAQSLETNTFIETLSNEIYKNNDSYFIGRGSDYAVALEGSLKLKEISYIHSEAYAAGELKHGPIALIEQNVPVIGIATNQLTFEKTLNNLEEALTRGGKIILITNTPDYINTSFDTIVKIPQVHYLLSPIISVIPLQLLAYHIAKNKKLDVDKPRNLAKSVTVE